MASSRPMRKSSRKSSPMDLAVKDTSLQKNDESREKVVGEVGWKEPPLRNPVPSFEEYKGLERHGVLEHMAPLGSHPNPKAKLRAKGNEPPRRDSQVKNGEVAVTKNDVSATESNPPTETKRPEPQETEDRPQKVAPLRETDDDREYMPKKGIKTTPVKGNLTQHSLPGTPSSRTSTRHLRLKGVVDSAVARANELGDPFLGLALRKLFDESLHSRTLADLLDAVLLQKQTTRQATDFQGYIKVARKQIKAEASAARRSSRGLRTTSNSISKSPSMSVRPSVLHQTEILQDVVATTNTTTILPITKTPPSIPEQPPDMADNIESAQERPTKRRKRSSSLSTISSLSSLPSTDRELSPTLNLDRTVAPKPCSDSQSTTKPLVQTKHLLGPKLHTFTTTKHNRTPIKQPTVTTGGAHDDTVEESIAKRRKLQRTFDDYSVQDSGVRTSNLFKKQAPASSSSLRLAPIRPQRPHLRNGTPHKRQRDDYDELQSPGSSAHGELLIPPPAGARSSSRGATPNQLGRPMKRVIKSARVKMSPIKKKQGVTAGIARTGAGRDGSVNHVDEKEAADDQDSCEACGGNGMLILCDGCNCSLHFTCVDPPVDAQHSPEGEWFCNSCRPKQQKATSRIFSSLVASIEKKNPSAFHLPRGVRDFYEGVKTGEEGEYEEVTMVKVKSRPNGYEEAPNYLRLKDAKDNPIICYYCGKSSMGGREIIACDYCSLQWHLDCLNPPLSSAPRKVNSGKGRNTWMCPNHIDSELQAIDPSIKATGTAQEGGRKFRVRRPKKACVVESLLSRGLVNNGLIEVLNEPSDEEGYELDGEADDVNGVIYSLPEKGIKLDFIARVKRSNAETMQYQSTRSRVSDTQLLREASRARNLRRAESKRHKEMLNQSQKEAFENRPSPDRQAAFGLARLAHPHRELSLGRDEVENLIKTLLAEAPAEVLDLISKDTQHCMADSVPALASLIQSGVEDPSVLSEPKGVSDLSGNECLEDQGSTKPSVKDGQSTSSTSAKSAHSKARLTEPEKKKLLLLVELIRRRLAEPEEVASARCP